MFFIKTHRIFLLVVCLMAVLSPRLNAQQTEYGAYLGIIPGDKDNFFVDNANGKWANRDLSFILSAQYNRSVGQYFMVGIYGELETINLSGGFDNGVRFGTGLTWTGRTDKVFFDWLKFELGGCGGLALAAHSGRDKMVGIDFGVFFGPYYQINDKLIVAFHLADGYGYYHGDTDPMGEQNVRPFFKLQIYYRP